MTIILKWLLRIGIVAIGLAIASAFLVYFLLARSLPDYAATHEVNGINGPVEIVRDRYAIPHIFGGTDDDVFFGLGFAHAQDRLWQMALLRRTAYGRLSEIFGPQTLAVDRMMRVFDVHALSVKAFDEQDTPTQSALNAYAQGVNAWLRIVDQSFLQSTAPEFLFIDSNIRPWEPFDSLAILNLQAINLSDHAAREVLKARALSRVTEERLNDLMPSEPGGGFVGGFPKVISRANEDMNVRRSLAESNHEPRVFPFNPMERSTGASNMWAASANQTLSSAPLLASDPHLDFSAPSIWMLARLELSTGGVIGATIPGSPVIINGRSPNLAWGVTASYVDDQDVFFEKYSPFSQSQYQTPLGSADFRTKIEVIAVKGENPEQIQLQWTDNGPVLPEDFFALREILPRDQFASLGWTLFDERNTSMTAGLRLMKAATIDEALDAASLHRSPQLNLLIASRSEIAMQVIGSVPRRSLFHETMGDMPSAGWKWRNRWQGEMPYSTLPRFRNPQNGFLGNTNNKVIDRPFPDHLSHYWGDTFRFKRLEELLLARQDHTVDSFANIQLDNLSLVARVLIPEFARNLWKTMETVSLDESVQFRNTALKRLYNWDGMMDANRPEPLIYAAWARAVQRQLISDELGDLDSEFRRPDPKFLERVFENIDGAAIWCDIIQTEVTESCDDIAILALDEALSQLRHEYGSDIRTWRWGDAHQAVHDHQILAESTWLSWLFGIRQPVSGGDHTLNMEKMSAEGRSPFNSQHGPGYRGIYDFSDLDSSRYIISTGQSGHPLSPHFDDQNALWKAGGYAVMSLDPAHARVNAVGITALEPAPDRN